MSLNKVWSVVVVVAVRIEMILADDTIDCSFEDTVEEERTNS